MQGITLIQPYANVIADGKKRYETRNWRTNYTGLLAIHAGRRRPEHVSTDGPFGVIVAVARLVGCVSTSVIKSKQATIIVGPGYPLVTQSEREFGDWSPGRWAWALADVHKLAIPVSCRGSQGLWVLWANLHDRCCGLPMGRCERWAGTKCPMQFLPEYGGWDLERLKESMSEGFDVDE